MPCPGVQQLWLKAEEPRVRTFERDMSWSNDTAGWSMARSHAWFCIACWDFWAISKLEDLYGGQLIVRTHPCEKHRDSDHEELIIPGSIIPDIGYPGWGLIDWPLLEALPVDLLRREFNLHMAFAENEGVSHGEEA